MRIQSTVASRLLMGLSIMAALAVLAVLIGHFAVDRYKEPFRQTAAVDLPNLVSASRLAEDAVSMTADAATLVMARSQSGRRDIMARAQDRIDGMTKLVNRFSDADVTADTVQYVVKQGVALSDNLKKLDRQIDRRIDLDTAIGQATAGLSALADAIAERPRTLDASGGDSGDWRVSAEYTLALLAQAADATQAASLEALDGKVATGVSRLEQALAMLPQPQRTSIEGLCQSLERLASQETGIPALKAQQFATVEQINALLNRNKVLSTEMVQMVSSVSANIEGNVLRRNQEIIQSSRYDSVALLIIAIICIAVAVIIVIYINRNVVRRLRELVLCMVGAVKGNHTVVIPAQSDDEIGELGRAFLYFVETNQEREAALRASEQRQADIINLLPDATMVIDLNGKVLLWNRAMEVMTKVAARDIIGKGNYEYALPFYGERRPILVDMALKPDAFIPGAYPHFEPRGDTIWAETGMTMLHGKPAYLRGSASVLRDAEGKVVGAIETIFDITERRNLIDALRGAKDTAERASQSKSIFLATMSHELRTPLNSIIGFADLVASQSFGPVGDPQYIEHAEYGRQSAHHLLDIINGMLDLSKIEAGMMKLEQVRVAVAPIVKRTARMVQDLALGARVAIKLAVPPNLPDLWADERATRQILINLLGNAIKFNNAGGSILVTALEAGPFIEIVVADTGAGIPDDEIDRVRKPFEQLNNQYTRASGGTGLGLSIVEGLVNLHGGSLTIASVVGKGTAVSVLLPTVPEDGASAPQPTQNFCC